MTSLRLRMRPRSADAGVTHALCPLLCLGAFKGTENLCLPQGQDRRAFSWIPVQSAPPPPNPMLSLGVPQPPEHLLISPISSPPCLAAHVQHTSRYFWDTDTQMGRKRVAGATVRWPARICFADGGWATKGPTFAGLRRQEVLPGAMAASVLMGEAECEDQGQNSCLLARAVCVSAS